MFVVVATTLAERRVATAAAADLAITRLARVDCMIRLLEIGLKGMLTECERLDVVNNNTKKRGDDEGPSGNPLYHPPIIYFIC